MLARGETNGEKLVARYPISRAKQLEPILIQLSRQLDRLSREALPSKVVQELLEITPAECSRWTKDGRLPKSGTSQFKRGRRKVQLYTYDADKVLELRSHPELIARWRRSDLSDQKKVPTGGRAT